MAGYKRLYRVLYGAGRRQTDGKSFGVYNGAEIIWQCICGKEIML